MKSIRMFLNEFKQCTGKDVSIDEIGYETVSLYKEEEWRSCTRYDLEDISTQSDKRKHTKLVINEKESKTVKRHVVTVVLLELI